MAKKKAAANSAAKLGISTKSNTVPKARRKKASAPVAEPSKNVVPTITAWSVYPIPNMKLEPAPSDRQWMDETPVRYAYRCLPLVIANQNGWIIRCPHTFTVRWNGGIELADVKVKCPKTVNNQMVQSHFGSGIVTFMLPYMFRTSPGINLWAKGPANYIKDGIQALEGVIETDWLESTFTMNWKMTRRNHTVTFEEGEPICMLVPIPRGFTESLKTHMQPLSENPELAATFNQWSEARRAFNEGLAKNDPKFSEQGWQRDYMLGRKLSGDKFPEHQMRLEVAPFPK